MQIYRLQLPPLLQSIIKQKKSVFIRNLLVVLFFLSFKTFASIDDYLIRYTSPSFSNYGSVGAIQNPTARFLPEGTISFSWSHLDPYLRGSIIASPFNWMEASYQYTDINNKLYSPVASFSGGQSFKDKSFDVKFMLLKETKKIPQIAIGLRDIAGTSNFSGEYIVASKNIKNFDAHLGLGWGTLSGGNSIKNPLCSRQTSFCNRTFDVGEGGNVSTDSFFRGENAAFYGGIEWYLRDIRLNGSRLVLEYDSTNYSVEGPEKLVQDSKYNFSFVYPLSNSIQLKLGYIRGNTINFGFSISGLYGSKKNLLPKLEKKRKLKNAQAIQYVTEINNEYLYLASLKYLGESSFAMQSADLSNDTYKISYAQNKYINHAIAAGRITNILDQISQPDIAKFEITNINAGIALNTIKINRQEYKKSSKSLDSQSLKRFVEISKPNDDLLSTYKFQPKVNLPKHFYSIGPGVRSQLGGPDGFFLGQLLLRLDSEIVLKRNLNIQSIIQAGIYDTFDELKLASDSVLPHVRTEVVNYLKAGRKNNITRMQANYFHKIKEDQFLKFSAGLFEEMFGGIGFEYLYRPFDEFYAIGIDAYHARQRSYRQLFDFQEYKTLTGHLTLYITEPKSNTLIKLSGGRYLAKDSGITIDLSRKFKTGFRVGAFFSLTDISDEEFGEGSFDKGFYFNIPIQSFFTNYRPGLSSFGLRPLTRDGAAKLTVGHDLYGVTDSASSQNINFGWDEFYE